jgi:hypothetical protein
MEWSIVMKEMVNRRSEVPTSNTQTPEKRQTSIFNEEKLETRYLVSCN